MTPHTVGDLLFWSYANLAMAHAAVTSGVQTYGRTQFMIRARLFAGLRSGRMDMGSIADDERLKMILPQACCYCGGRDGLSIDHLFPRSRGGADSGDNLVWACRPCNSGKGASDMLEWFGRRGEFPPLLLLRRYLKLAAEICRERLLMDEPLDGAAGVPFAVSAVPTSFPQPTELRMWVV
jgi:hypothetical protein